MGFDHFTSPYMAAFLILLLMSLPHMHVTLWTFPLFIFSSLLLSLFIFFLSYFLALLHVFMRDTQFILQFVLNLAYFITPIFYPKELIPEKFHWLIKFNPFYILIQPFQHLFWRYNLRDYASDQIGIFLCLILIIITALTYWRTQKNALYFRI
jgi:lipopolysaccharide transport system permease protein